MIKHENVSFVYLYNMVVISHLLLAYNNTIKLVLVYNDYDHNCYKLLNP